MSMIVRWDSDSHDILYFAIQNVWTWAELQQHINAAVNLAGQPVPAIVDLRAWIGLPSSNLFLPENLKPVRALIERNTRRQMPIVIVGADADARMLYDCMRMMDSRIGWQVFFTETLDEARHFLRHELPIKQPAC